MFGPLTSLSLFFIFVTPIRKRVLVLTLSNITGFRCACCRCPRSCACIACLHVLFCNPCIFRLFLVACIHLAYFYTTTFLFSLVLYYVLSQRMFSSYVLLHCLLSMFVLYYVLSQCILSMYALPLCFSRWSVFIYIVRDLRCFSNSDSCWQPCYPPDRNIIWYTIFINGYFNGENFDDTESAMFGDTNLLCEWPSNLSAPEGVIVGRLIYKYCPVYSISETLRFFLSWSILAQSCTVFIHSSESWHIADRRCSNHARSLSSDVFAVGSAIWLLYVDVPFEKVAKSSLNNYFLFMQVS